MSDSSPTSGWYDDGSGNKRWWDGSQWGPYAPVQPVTVNVTVPPQAAPRAPVNGAAVAGLILGLLAILTCWVPGLGAFIAVFGIIFSSVGLWLVRQRSGAGRGMAASGLVMSVISAFVFLMILLISVASHSS